MLRFAAAAILIIITQTEANARLIVSFAGSRILTSDFSVRKVRLPANESVHKQVVDCDFVDRKTQCYEITKRHVDLGGFLFVHPIAIIPVDYVAEDKNLETQNTNNDEESWTIKALNATYVRSLQSYEVEPLTRVQERQVVNIYALPGPDSVSHVFAPASDVIGGKYALRLWKSLVGKMPSRHCDDGEDYCSVVLNAKRDGQDAIAYCAVTNTELGLGLPFKCNTAAYEVNRVWYVLSYNSPEQCDGCGAVSGASCDFKTSVPLSKAEWLLLKAMKDGKTNIDLIETGKTAEKIDLAGRKRAADSRFYRGYFEKASANYHLRVGVDEIDGKHLLEIYGIYVLLISADPSNRDIDYREIGDIEWFQDQVLKIIKTQVADKIANGRVECVTQPIY